jgi:hypothetical protein
MQGGTEANMGVLNPGAGFLGLGAANPLANAETRKALFARLRP